jgi:hypothetical protein
LTLQVVEAVEQALLAVVFLVDLVAVKVRDPQTCLLHQLELSTQAAVVVELLTQASEPLAVRDYS